jgi:transposase InsO family protein
VPSAPASGQTVAAAPEPATEQGGYRFQEHLQRLRRAQSLPRRATRPGRRRGASKQQARRLLEQEVRREVVQCCQKSQQQGYHLPDVASLLGLRPRTLRHWVRTYTHEQLRALPLGRPVLRSPRSARQELLDWLQEVGPGVGLPTLQREFPGLPRAELQELLRRWRWVWQQRHQREVQVLHWQRPGGVWAIDHAEPPALVDGLYPFVLAVRDLGSGQQLLWQPVKDATAETTCAALLRLFLLHGAPLVLKLDNGSAFRAELTQQLLAQWGVVSLYSPVRRPQYNGSIEAGIGSLKIRTAEQAARQGRAEQWSWDDLEAARLQGNELSRPRGVRGPTPDEMWAARRLVSAEERLRFQTTVACQQEELEREARMAEGNDVTKQEEARLLREAIRRALVAHDLLCVTRRSIPLPILLRNVTKIT